MDTHSSHNLDNEEGFAPQAKLFSALPNIPLRDDFEHETLTRVLLGNTKRLTFSEDMEREVVARSLVASVPDIPLPETMEQGIMARSIIANVQSVPVPDNFEDLVLARIEKEKNQPLQIIQSEKRSKVVAILRYLIPVSAAACIPLAIYFSGQNPSEPTNPGQSKQPEMIMSAPGVHEQAYSPSTLKSDSIELAQSRIKRRKMTEYAEQNGTMPGDSTAEDNKAE